MRNMTINSRRKGARFERELASALRAEGYDTRRTAQYCGNTGDASDVIGLPGIHIEAQHCEQSGWSRPSGTQQPGERTTCPPSSTAKTMRPFWSP